MADHRDRQLIFPGIDGKISHLFCITYVAQLLTFRWEARLLYLGAIVAQDVPTLRELRRPLRWVESFSLAQASARAPDNPVDLTGLICSFKDRDHLNSQPPRQSAVRNDDDIDIGPCPQS